MPIEGIELQESQQRGDFSLLRWKITLEEENQNDVCALVSAVYDFNGQK